VHLFENHLIIDTFGLLKNYKKKFKFLFPRVVLRLETVFLRVDVVQQRLKLAFF
jgi:hypothetical protein